MLDRGQVVYRKLKNKISFNGEDYERVEIELDHINFGLDPQTKKLNIVKRSSFTAEDVLKLLELLDEQYFLPKSSVNDVEYFVFEFISPLPGTSKGKLYRMIFLTHIQKKTIGTITIYRIKGNKK